MKVFYIVGAAIIIIVSLLAIWLLPSWLVENDKKDYVEVCCAKGDDLVIHDNMINAKRATIVQVVGGILFIIAMFLAYKRAKAMEDNAKAMGENVKSNRETLTLEQYAKAIDQLGNDKSIAVRLGAIYSLEQIMNSENEHDSKYHDQIIELLAAYVRENRKFDKADYKKYKDAIKENPGKKEKIREEYSKALETDERAILTVLGRRKNRDNEKVKIDLNNTYWIDANLSFMNLEGIIFTAAKLEKTNLYKANLNNADLMRANLNNATLTGVKLKNAELWKSNLMGIITSDLLYNEETNEYNYNETNVTRTAFIEELEKAKDVRGIQLDPEIMDIIKKDFPDLLKRIKEKNRTMKKNKVK